ncbi:MAG TPA: hypothetical protein QF373_09385, partial [Verrucomicrobiota bacterium]|nr:hypothetical protein [Verrucomicrobiota bacterium]
MLPENECKMRAKGLWDCGVIVPLDDYTTISSSRRRKKLNDPSVTVKNYDFQINRPLRAISGCSGQSDLERDPR